MQAAPGLGRRRSNEDSGRWTGVAITPTDHRNPLKKALALQLLHRFVIWH
ncbi:hypothetical protein ACFFX0_23610 [Citricoccus parietis]|uniref:Uncharacterized protein n=1 Tax=Citricoccus parietis TaxID=592307 RepID=A0ABV5G527_9MICC